MFTHFTFQHTIILHRHQNHIKYFILLLEMKKKKTINESRIKKEQERSPLSQEDEHTQTSSPGGWHSKLSALNFLHLQVHRRGTATSSRASSRKSSRASDASDLSELAGPWLNLPLMLVGGANDVLKQLEDDKKY